MTTETVSEITNTFFENLGVHFSDFSVIEEGDHIFRIKIKSEDSHLLIGPHGKNLESITHVVKILLQSKCDSHVTIHIEINDYLEKKEEKLLRFIDSKISSLSTEKTGVILPFLTAYERKKVHSYIAEKGGSVYTQSVGEGKDRRIHLCKKDEKMSIDIDGDDI